MSSKLVICLAIAVWLVAGCQAGHEQEKSSAVAIVYYWIPPAWLDDKGNSLPPITIGDFKKAGITFEGNAKILHDGPTGFGMANTWDNQDKLRGVLTSRFGDKWREYKAPP